MTGESKRPLTKLQLFLRLNAAKYFGGRIYYSHTIRQLRRLRGRVNTNSNDRITEMVNSRTGKPLVRSSLPLKRQRELHWLPAV